MQTFGKTQKICVSGIVIAIYVVVMYFTQSFAFLQYQIRPATGLYALSYLFPFLILPLGISNSMSNMLFGGLGPFDVIGGFIAGILTSGSIYLVRRFGLSALFVIPAIIFLPGLLVPLWLSPLLNVPYLILAPGICIGQILPAVLGYLLIKALPRAELFGGKI